MTRTRIAVVACVALLLAVTPAVAQAGPSADAEPAATAALDVSAAVDPCASPDVPLAPFTDVACGAVFGHEIWWAADAGIASGYADGTYGPRLDVSRQAVARFLYVLAGSPEGPFPDPGFLDVVPGEPFATEIAWLVDANIAGGYGDGTFRPEIAVTRQIMASFLHGMAGSPEGPFPDPGFLDVAPGSPFADEIAWLADVGIATGYLDGVFGPRAPVSRQAIAGFLYRRHLLDLVDPATADRCEPLDPTECLLPYPSDHLTVPDSEVDRPIGTSGTGLRLDLDPASMPTNDEGVPVDPTQLNQNDGFSPGQAIVLRVPGIDLAETGAPPITDLARALDDDAPMVIVDAVTGERVPLFAELDATTVQAARRTLILRPTRNLTTGHRHVVALRRLRDGAGEPILAPETFTTYRDQLRTGIDAVEDRRAGFEDVFSVLAGAGIDRHDLFLAWDFTVASDQNLHERILHLRDEAFAALGVDVPSFTVDEVIDDPNPSIAREVRGTLTVPKYLTGDGGPGAVMAYGDDGLPEATGTMTVEVTCIVPNAASAATPARISLFGHGLLGSGSDVLGFSSIADVHDTVFCGIDWLGMSSADLPTVVDLLGELSSFHTIPDRAQQGFLAFLFLGRLMQHPDGLAALPAFQDGGESLLDTSELVYVGGSQGGIMGASLVAVAQDLTKAVLAVPGANYSTMLQRSSNWPQFNLILSGSYPDPLVKSLGLSMIQGLWDRGEANGYAHRIVSDPLPDTPAKQVLLFEAFGDHQVANIATETMARTMGVPVRRPALGEGRSPIVDPYWGLDPVPSYPYEGSALVVWDWGTPAPPLTNTRPTQGDDPHGNITDTSEVAAQQMLLHFVAEGELIDVCGGAPCTSP